MTIRKQCCFFFQAEDGIRDLVRSRGLGDVYKRQQNDRASNGSDNDKGTRMSNVQILPFPSASLRAGSVSYTHLTLPTSDLV